MSDNFKMHVSWEKLAFLPLPSLSDFLPVKAPKVGLIFRFVNGSHFFNSSHWFWVKTFSLFGSENFIK